MYGAFDLALLVHKIDLQGLKTVNRNVGGELWQGLVQFRLRFPLVVAVVLVGC